MSLGLITYLLAIGLIFGTNLLPAFGPPTVALLVFFSLNTEIHGVALVLGGAVAAATGRLVLAQGTRRWRHRFSDERRANLSAAQELLTNNRTKTLSGLAFFVFSPVPSAQLFVAAGLMTVPLVPVTLAFFSGRIVSYATYVTGASLAEQSLGGALTASFTSPVGIAVQLVMLAGIVALVQVDWARLVVRHNTKD